MVWKPAAEAVNLIKPSLSVLLQRSIFNPSPQEQFLKYVWSAFQECSFKTKFLCIFFLQYILDSELWKTPSARPLDCAGVLGQALFNGGLQVWSAHLHPDHLLWPSKDLPLQWRLGADGNREVPYAQWVQSGENSIYFQNRKETVLIFGLIFQAPLCWIIYFLTFDIATRTKHFINGNMTAVSSSSRYNSSMILSATKHTNLSCYCWYAKKSFVMLANGSCLSWFYLFFLCLSLRVSCTCTWQITQ